MFSIFNNELIRILNGAKKEMLLLKHSYIGTEHLVLSILNSKSNVCMLLNENNINYDTFKNKVIEFIGEGKKSNNLFVFTPLMKKIIEDSIMISNDLKKNEIDINLIFSLMLDEGEGVAYRIFCELGVDLNILDEEIQSMNITKSSNATIINFGINLNEKYINNGFDPVVGRDNEVSRLIEIILRKNKCNPLLIGDAGVGKTSIVEELARRIVNGDVPLKLRNKVIISISMADLVSGTKYRGEFEEKLLRIISEVEKSNNIILFIDEIHTLVGAGGADGAIDASNIFKPALARGNITVIGATTIDEYKKYFEDDRALSRRFQKIIVEEPNEENLLKILKKSKSNYEKFHNVEIDNTLLEYLIHISKKYIINRKEPDRSLDILDEVCSYTSSMCDEIQIENSNLRKKLIELKDSKNKFLKNNEYNKAIECRKEERKIESLINKNEMKFYSQKIPKKVKKDYINKIISQKCCVNLYNKEDIKSVVLKLKNELKKDILRQNENIDCVVDSCAELFYSDNILEKPISFLFCGNTGVGKSYFAEKLGNLLFNNHIIKVNFNEFRDEQSISRIIGAPPGYVGYNNKNNVFESLKEFNSALILLENFENAHYKVKSLISQIINDGYFEDSNGYKIDFRNSLIILTTKNKNTNIVGFANKAVDSDNFDCYKKIIYFNDLEESDIIKIIKKKLKDKIGEYTFSDVKNIVNKSDYKNFGAKKIESIINNYSKILMG